ncbi:MAG TPA: helix-turn-helix transcriptional regulator [Solirubrobacteraceae bacterium]|nr:helix-turn-helix transcriptional regulator [Solirubrobacteraceae bacterium]
MSSPATTTAPPLIAEIRERSGLRAAELARRAGLPRSVVSAYEHGSRQPGVEALARLAAAGGLRLRLGPAPPPVDPQRASRILSQVLDLAEALPARRREALEYPSLAAMTLSG